MSPQDFTYWLQGYLELSGAQALNEEQVTIIKEHLQLVFEKKPRPTPITPDEIKNILNRPNSDSRRYC